MSTPRLLRMRRLHHIRAPGGASGHQQATNLLAVGEFAIIGAELLLREGTIAAAPVIRPLRLPPSAGTTSHRLQLRMPATAPPALRALCHLRACARHRLRRGDSDPPPSGRARHVNHIHTPDHRTKAISSSLPGCEA